MPEDNQTIVIFDTNCVLCSGGVRFFLQHERSNSVQFASSRKEAGIRLAAEYNLSEEDLDLTFLVIQNGQALTKTDASLALVKHLKAPWNFAGVFRLVPRPLRDALYDIVARNRLNWFGEQQDCFLPTAEQRRRFLDH